MVIRTLEQPRNPRLNLRIYDTGGALLALESQRIKQRDISC